jgi:hypothetical protein
VSGGASCRCVSLPAWPSQLVRQGLSGPPRFRASPSARATLSDPGKLSTPSPGADVSILGSGKQTPSPLASGTFEAESLKQDAGPTCGSRFSLGTLLDGRSSRWNHKSTGSPSAKQPSVLGSWLDFSIHHFRSELRRLSLQTWGTFTPGFARLLRAHPLSTFRFPLLPLRLILARLFVMGGTNAKFSVGKVSLSGHTTTHAVAPHTRFIRKL